MTFVFFLQHPGLLRFYGTTIELLANRGHRIQLAFSAGSKDGADTKLVDRLEGVAVSSAPSRRGPSRAVAAVIRHLADLARYGDPRYAQAPKLRERAVHTVSERLRVPRVLAARLASPRLLPLLRAAERAIPSSRRIDRALEELRPDAVLVSPVVDFGSAQGDYVKSATALGIPCGVLVASWDNLTGKGLIRGDPDRVFVWNEAQRDEAVDLHGIAPGQVVVTGAPKFDEWFDRRPSTSAADFAARVGLPEGFVLYLCSSPFIAPEEVPFVRDWLRALRDRTAVPVLVRPHPQNARQWDGVDLSDAAPVAVWPRGGAQPDEGQARADFYDSLAHATAVVGVNTSGLIEAAIVGRSVYTILDPRFAETQEGTLHFRHLRAEHGGFLHEASSFEEHLDQLLSGRRADSRGFVERFVRPHGLDRPATPILADALEELGASRDRVAGDRETRGDRPPAG